MVIEETTDITKEGTTNGIMIEIVTTVINIRERKEMVIEETTQERILEVILFEIMRNNFLLGNSCEGYDKRKEVRNNFTAQMVKHKESFIFTNKAEQCPSFLLFTTLFIFSKRKCTL